jgi:hypothetical protein
VQERGIRFHLGSPKGIMRLFSTMIRAGMARVDQAMDCIKLEAQEREEEERALEDRTKAECREPAGLDRLCVIIGVKTDKPTLNKGVRTTVRMA